MSDATAMPLAPVSSRSKSIGRVISKNQVAALSGLILLVIFSLALLAPVLGLPDPVKMDPPNRLQAPGTSGLLGTDMFGRDIFSRILYGTRISLMVGVLAVLAAAFVGTLIGLIAGYLGKWQEYWTMRLMDVLFSFPSIVLAILIVSIIGAGFPSIILAIALVQTPIFARLVRGSTLAVKNIEYVHAAEAGGASTWRILRRHILPNVAAPILVQLALSMSGAITMEAALSYLGLGAVPPTPSLGSMLSENRSAMEIAPWTVLYPGIALAVIVLCINMFGDAVRDYMDPRIRKSG